MARQDFDGTHRNIPTESFLSEVAVKSVVDATCESEVIDKLTRLVSLPSVGEEGLTEGPVVREVAAWCEADDLSYQIREVGFERAN